MHIQHYNGHSKKQFLTLSSLIAAKVLRHEKIINVMSTQQLKYLKTKIVIVRWILFYFVIYVHVKCDLNIFWSKKIQIESIQHQNDTEELSVFINHSKNEIFSHISSNIKTSWKVVALYSGLMLPILKMAIPFENHISFFHLLNGYCSVRIRCSWLS